MSATRLLSLTIVLLVSAPGCGDDCDEGYIDTYGFCTTEGLGYQLAGAVVGAVVILDAALADNGTFPCSGGGEVTVVESGPTTCGGGGCVGDLTWTFAGCTLEHDTVHRLRFEASAGSLRDQSSSQLGNPTVFTHHLTGQATFSSTVRLKAKPRDVAERTCNMDFVHTSELRGDTTVSGSFCDEEVVMPLYELGG